ncbi:AzlD domain-containing protein [Salinivibrio socompensis]|uniref:AzlD domain-containing protein n=1 Tax=Salinivibrio socompensis TaxID=1510206 RepID=UPI000472F2D1|nr:AzlD domain-containing protein [Salinivibrio socompensis]
MNYWVMIVAMALITFSVRYLLLARSVPVRIGPRLQRLLTYSAPAVLTALWVPIVFFPEDELSVTATNPYLLGALLAIGLACTRLSTLLVVGISIGFFVTLQLWGLR